MIPRVTVIPEDSSVVVDSVSLLLPLPLIDAAIRAVQFYPETGHATVENRAGERAWLEGDAAFSLVQPFIEAHAAELARLEAGAKVQAADRTAQEQAEADRVARIRAANEALDKEAADRVARIRAACEAAEKDAARIADARAAERAAKEDALRASGMALSGSQPSANEAIPGVKTF